MRELGRLNQFLQPRFAQQRLDDRSLIGEAVAEAEPLGDLGLRIHVDEQRLQPPRGQPRGEVHGDGALAATAFSVDDSDDLHGDDEIISGEVEITGDDIDGIAQEVDPVAQQSPGSSPPRSWDVPTASQPGWACPNPARWPGEAFLGDSA